MIIFASENNMLMEVPKFLLRKKYLLESVLFIALFSICLLYTSDAADDR